MFSCNVENWSAKFGNLYKTNPPRYLQYFCEEVHSVQLDTPHDRVITGTGTLHGGVGAEGQIIIWYINDNVNSQRKRGKHVIVDKGQEKWIRNSMSLRDNLLLVGGGFPTREFPPVEIYRIAEDLDYSPKAKNVIAKVGKLDEEYFGVVYLEKTINKFVCQKEAKRQSSNKEEEKEEEENEEKEEHEEKDARSSRKDYNASLSVFDLETLQEITSFPSHGEGSTPSVIRDCFLHGPSHLLVSITEDSRFDVYDIRTKPAPAHNPVFTKSLHKFQTNVVLKVSSPVLKTPRSLVSLVTLASQPYPQPSVVQYWDLRKLAEISKAPKDEEQEKKKRGK